MDAISPSGDPHMQQKQIGRLSFTLCSLSASLSQGTGKAIESQRPFVDPIYVKALGWALLGALTSTALLSFPPEN